MFRSLSKRCALAFAMLLLSAFAINTADAQATLTMGLTVSPTFDIDINGNQTYTATINNSGPGDATNLAVKFAMPSGDLAISGSPAACVFSGDLSATCPLGTLTAGSTATVILVVHPTQVGTLAVSGAATADGNVSASAQVSSQIIEVGIADVAIQSFTATPNPAQVNAPLTYTTTVFNFGDDDAANVYTTLTLPKGAKFSSATKGCTHSNTLVVCKIGHMGVGASQTVDVTILPTVSGWTQATVGVRMTTPDPSTLNNSAASAIWVNP
jgi:uncharacterized repeat protein (TIGR01451 family)